MPFQFLPPQDLGTIRPNLASGARGPLVPAPQQPPVDGGTTPVPGQPVHNPALMTRGQAAASIAPPPAPKPPQTTAPTAGSNDPAAIKAFITQWQQSHPANGGIESLVNALAQAGFNVNRWDVGNGVLSNNELNIGGEKFKVLSAENSGNPSWYVPGTDDGGGGGAAGAGGGLGFGSLLSPAGTPFNMNDVINDPGFERRQAAFQKSLDRSSLNSGTFNTGGFKIDAASELADNASAEFGNAFSRGLAVNQANNGLARDQQMDAYNKLFGVTGLGLGAAGTQVDANTRNSGYQQQGAETQGNINAQGTATNANNWSNLITNLGGAGAYYAQNRGQGGGTATSRLPQSIQDVMRQNSSGTVVGS